LKRILIYLLLCLTISPNIIQAQENASSNQVELRIPPEESIEEYRKDKDFQYDEGKKFNYPTWLQRILDWFSKSFSKTLNAAFSREVLIIIFVILLTALIVTIVLRTQGVSFKNLFGKRRMDTDETQFFTEDVNKMDFDQLIAESIKTKNYRLAVRFLYLKNLKSLSDHSIINWNPNKTNYSYQYEIENSTLRTRFLESTRIFDFVWYGEFLLDEQSFNEAHHHFNDFNRAINNG